MTAAEIYELVKDWPREAWPERVYYKSECGIEFFIHADQNYADVCALPSPAISLMFEASGLAWLLKEAFVVRLFAMDGHGRTQITLSGSGATARKWGLDPRFEGPTRLHAISAAVRAAKGAA